VRGRVLAVQILVVCGFFGLWEAASRLEWLDPRLLPPASLVLPTAWSLLGDEVFLRHLGVTMWQVSIAIVIATPLGTAIGVALAESQYLDRAFRPYFNFLAAVPKSVFLPVFILLFGIGVEQKVAFGVFQALFVIVITTGAAVAGVPADLVRLARAYGASRWQTWAEVHWHSMLPLLLEGLRLGMIFNITGVVFAEMYVARLGLGQRLANWGQAFQMPELFAGIVIAAALSIAVNEALRALERRVGRWRPA
jgi:ABC-type nitrate/sulfonate/bicarbonate transport system permease component